MSETLNRSSRNALGFRMGEDAATYSERVRAHFEVKANHNKRESLGCFMLVIGSTLAVSAFVAFGHGIMAGKVVPVCLSLLATALSTWLQFRKPHQLWSIYRSAQRYIESHQVRYQFEVAPYENPQKKDKLLVKNITKIMLAAHELWVPLIPSPEGLDRLRSEKPKLVKIDPNVDVSMRVADSNTGGPSSKAGSG